MDNNIGHRERIRERLLNSKFGAMQDYEILELLLCLVIPRKDTKPLAKSLLAKYGSFAKVITAEAESLLSIPGIGKSVVACFRLMVEGAARLLKDEIRKKPILTSWNSLLNYCRSIIGHSKKEMFIIFYLNNQNELIEEDIFDYGTVNEINVYPREIAKRALFLNASAIILAHNHPGGETKPSKADIKVTQDIAILMSSFNIKIHDHIIVSDKSFFSFKEGGLL